MAAVGLKRAKCRDGGIFDALPIASIAALKQGNKSDKIDARELANRLRLNDLKPVYHGETGVRMLRELARSYLTIVKDFRGSSHA